MNSVSPAPRVRVFLLHLKPATAADATSLRDILRQGHRKSDACPAGPGDTVTVHSLGLNPACHLDQAWPLLAPSEAQRAARLREDGARQTYVLAHAALRLLLAFELAESEAVWQEFAQGPFGKPRLGAAHGQVHFNLSWRPGIAAVALGTVPLGIDVEPWREGVDIAGISERFFAAPERAMVAPDVHPRGFFRLWTRKEALIKAAGAGIDLLPLAGALESCASLKNEQGLPATYCLHSLASTEDCSLALAVELPRTIATAFAATHDPSIS